MTYQLHIHRFNSQNRSWIKFFSKIILSLIVINTATMFFTKDVEKLIMLNVLTMVLIGAWIHFHIKSNKLPYISIQDSKLEYYCLKERKIIIIRAEEITHITHRFCELRVHTKDHVHYLSLEPVRKEKKRWEIKEMIQQWAHA